MKRGYVIPGGGVEYFTPNESVSLCGTVACQVGKNGNYNGYGASNGWYHWNGVAPRGSQCDDHSGDCSIASHNEFRYINNDTAADFVSESNKAQGRLTGGFTSYIDNDQDGKISIGDTIFWYTNGRTNGVVDTRRWNHWGTVEAADDNHPNRS